MDLDHSSAKGYYYFSFQLGTLFTIREAQLSLARYSNITMLQALGRILKAFGTAIKGIFEYVSHKLFRSRPSPRQGNPGSTSGQAFSTPKSRFLPEETVASIYNGKSSGKSADASVSRATPTHSSSWRSSRSPDVRSSTSGARGSSGSGSRGGSSGSRGGSSGSRGGSGDSSEVPMKASSRKSGHGGYWLHRFNSRMEMEKNSTAGSTPYATKSAKSPASPASDYIPWKDDQPDSKKELFKSLTEIENMASPN